MNFESAPAEFAIYRKAQHSKHLGREVSADICIQGQWLFPQSLIYSTEQCL